MNEDRGNIESPPLSIRKIIRYLKGFLSDKEQNKIERRLLDDAFEGEAMEGFSLVDTTSMSEDLRYLRESVTKRTTGSINKRFAVWQVAAAVLFVMVFSLGTWMIMSSDKALEIVYEQSTEPEEEKIQMPGQNPQQQKQMEKDRQEAIRESTTSSPALDQQIAINDAGSSKENISSESKAGERITEPAEASASIESGDEALKKLEPKENIPVLIGDEEAIAWTQDNMVEKKDQGGAELPAAATQKSNYARAMTKEATLMAVDAAVEEESNELEFRTITGMVVSAEDGDPIAQALLSVQGSQTEVYSRIDGYFELLVPVSMDILLQIRRSGYLPNEVRPEPEGPVEILLEPDTSLTAETIILGYDLPTDPYYSPPRPLGGNGALKDFIHDNLNLPDSALSGIVHIQFTVSDLGALEKIRVLSTPESALDEEVIRILQQGPPWYPAEQNGQAIPAEVDLRIRL